MVRYLRSQTTGVVLPYNEKLLSRPNVELMTPDECSVYEAGLKPRAASTVVETVTTVVETTTAPEPEPTPEPEPEPTPEPEEETAESLLGALEID